MYYEIHGNGASLVLIHGGGSTIQTTFGNILPLLANKYKIIAVELQAHGHTSDRDSEETFAQDADDISALLDYLNNDDDLRSIKAPSLIINGDHDVTTVEHAVNMFHLIPNGELLILPGIHGSFIGEVCTVKEGSKIPEMTVALVQEFLEK